jgi:hypothetical protein
MRTECFVCGTYLGGVATSQGTSHGLCPACARQLTCRQGRARWRSRLREVAEAGERESRSSRRGRRLAA